MAILFIFTLHLNVYSYCVVKLSGHYLWYAIHISDNFNNVIQRQQGIAFQLSVDVLSLGTGSQQLHECVMIRQSSILIGPLPLRAHHLQQHLERRAVVVEHQHVLTSVHQLETQTEKNPRRRKV